MTRTCSYFLHRLLRLPYTVYVPFLSLFVLLVVIFCTYLDLSSFWFVWPLHMLYVSGWSFAGLLYSSMDEYVVLLSLFVGTLWSTILLTAVLKWFHILSMLSKVWSLKFSPNTIRFSCILYILAFFHRDILCRVCFGLMGLHSSNTMWWSLFPMADIGLQRSLYEGCDVKIKSSVFSFLVGKSRGRSSGGRVGRNFFKCAPPPPLTWNPGSAPEVYYLL